ncbi:MAG: glycosyltransferase family 2 protein [Candidatus Binatia bacterium]|nr:glycosyltransferase family 2 protein [Candidatus Binatia bacterium]
MTTRGRRLSVVIVNWNGADYLGDCVDSAAGDDREVFVVDNASTDDSEARIRANRPWLRWISNEANLGFSTAANRGLEAASGEYVLFLNPDARSDEAAVSACIDVLASTPDVGLVGVAVRDPEGDVTPTVEPFFSFRSLRRARAEDRVTAPGGIEPVDIDWCHGVFLVGRRTDLLELEGFDERFFLYAEDMDLCHRVHESGRRVVYLPQVSIVHEGNRAGRVLLAERRAAAIFSSSLQFYALHHGLLARLGLRLAAGLSFAARALVYSLQSAPLAERYVALARVAFGAPPALFPTRPPSSRGAA